MSIFLGCDGGGTKLALCLADERGQVLGKASFPGIMPLRESKDAYVRTLRGYVQDFLKKADLAPDALAAAAFALTCCGESRESTAWMEEAVSRALPGVPFLVMGDQVAGWCGALGGQSGIHVVAGTGSIAYGEDGHGGKARAGGWTVFYGDEGSSYWAGVQAVNAFFRQADGRMEKTCLYDYFMELFHLQDPLHVAGAIDEFTDNGDVAKVASLQRHLKNIWDMGDPVADAIYRRGAAELADLVRALMGRLHFEVPPMVSYSGGLFRGGDCILVPFREEVEALGARLTQPRFGPMAGAVGLAARDHVDRETLLSIMEGVDRYEASTHADGLSV
ncbi:MAG: hypothetical protein IJ083_15915 [Clostridia bacterium]|nr:hypothetical protein [Clostridia bacterium]